jgi:hypothetical protein
MDFIEVTKNDLSFCKFLDKIYFQKQGKILNQTTSSGFSKKVYESCASLSYSNENQNNNNSPINLNKKRLHLSTKSLATKFANLTVTY